MTETSNEQTRPWERRQEMRQSASLAPETHNDEQDDHRNQAQEVSRASAASDPRNRLADRKPSRTTTRAA